MIIEYNIGCFERTLKIELDDKYEHLRESLLKSLDEYYTEWHNTDQDNCLEEFMVHKMLDEYKIPFYKGWDSIPYGDDYEPRETLWVCEHCLWAIESREGDQATLRHYVDETDAVDSMCGWCGECGFEELYELI
jgi:hypothetical protein